MAPFPDPQQTRDLAARAAMDPKTVRRAYRDPQSVQPSTLIRISRAAASLGVIPPWVPERHAERDRSQESDG
jgi:DNA-binding LacI/PurR family transcriptional regulator